MKLEDISDDQLADALNASLAPKTREGIGGNMDNYHCLSASADDEVIPNERIAYVGGPNAEQFYSVPIDVQRLRAELSKLLG